jgi:hypothetical protein
MIQETPASLQRSAVLLRKQQAEVQDGDADRYNCGNTQELPPRLYLILGFIFGLGAIGASKIRMPCNERC